MYNKNENITKKQLSFVNDLIKRGEENQKIVDDYVKSLKKGSIEELSKKEASSLLDKLLKK
ncbi:MULTISPECIES: hypothetical protein [Ferroplasma]|jgi:hypothetical protein|uniref:Uncharacterized protein n=2 Tax=Ferroplasma TaxID=74968 RepID=S0ARF6_FERAC|nr:MULTISPECIES: hypothetical protein [Ferroplasma]MCL4348802.1 hypothetical protein [Candidatus Thermoplasmatota archaeon]AGO61556.1 hypothetical protein FACI_IFERC00001G1576 [Ferroplasma acidarmanus Fer1]ARD84467.1 hypothetical protein FAD_0555 [Ferroplasma acidiphilum]NOL59363.1 hypothetical protein [Ferroplasma acidiphilum]WMT53396.1 MAG: hypothetical protein RE473_00770 [Ferroplasma acidiphilum]